MRKWGRRLKGLNQYLILRLIQQKDNLKKLQKGEIDLGGLEKSVKKVVDPHLLNYLDTWDKIDEMLRRVLSEDLEINFQIQKIMVGYTTGIVLIMFIIILILEEEI